jgi:hypothetical protein
MGLYAPMGIPNVPLFDIYIEYAIKNIQNQYHAENVRVLAL